MLDNKESFNKVGISRNDEPTRFLTEEEMEQLEQARFNYETKVENTPKTTVEKNNKIKIEDIAPETKTKLTISQKTKNVVRKILIVASFVIVAILGFYLAFSWNMQGLGRGEASTVIQKDSAGSDEAHSVASLGKEVRAL